MISNGRLSRIGLTMSKKGIAQEFSRQMIGQEPLCSSREKVLAIMWEALILFRKNQKVSICLLVVSARAWHRYWMVFLTRIVSTWITCLTMTMTLWHCEE